MEEGRPRSGGGASWGPPPAPVEATRAAGRRPMTTHQLQQQVKVKHIVTREVSTDVANFKEVVQRLTGKDSAAARAAVVAAGAVVDGTSYWSGGGTAAAAGLGATTSTGVTSSSGAVAFDDNVAGAGGAAGVTPTPTMFLSEEDMRRWWQGDA